MKYFAIIFTAILVLRAGSIETILQSTKLHTYEYSTSADPKHFIYIQGGLHGNEFLASEFVLYLSKQLEKKTGPLAALKNYQFVILPYANPSGTSLASRLNSRKINLNRNFGMFWSESRENFGISAFSETETSQIRDILKSKPFTAAIDVHGFINWFVMPSTPANAAKKQKISLADTARYAFLEKTLKANLPENYELKKALELGDGGAFEDWAFWSEKIPAFCLELFDEQRYLSQSLTANFEAVKDVFFNLYQKNIIAKPGTMDQFLFFEKKLAEILTDLSKNTDFDTYAQSKDQSQ